MRMSWRGAVGLALTVFLLWWVFRDVHWADVARELRNANMLLVALAVVTGTLMFPLRAARWIPILAPVARVGFAPAWRATAIGMMANNVLPARIGEIVRAWVLTRETPVPLAASFASLVVDRVFDAFVVILLMVLAMFDPGFPTGATIGGRPVATYAVPGLIGLGILALLLYAIVFFPDRLIRLYELFARRVAPGLEERGRQMLHAFADGLSVLRHPVRFGVVFLWTLAHWLVQALAFWIMFVAIGIDAPYSAAVFVQGLIVIGVALPSTPGFFGLFEAAARAGLVLYGVSESLAVTWGVTYHVLSLIPITVIGLWYLARAGLRLGQLRELQQA